MTAAYGLYFMLQIVPFRLRFTCKTREQEMDDANQVAQTVDSISLMDHTSNDLIWYFFCGSNLVLRLSFLICRQIQDSSK